MTSETGRPASSATASAEFVAAVEGIRSEERESSLRRPLLVRDVMSFPVVSIRASASLDEATRLMSDHHVSGLPVTEAEQVVGVLSEKDVVRVVLSRIGLKQLPSHLLALFHVFSSKRAGATLAEIRTVMTGTTVGRAMTRPAHLTTPDSTAEAAGRTMIEHGIHRLPVVERGALVGMVTRDDVFRFASGEIAPRLPPRSRSDRALRF